MRTFPSLQYPGYLGGFAFRRLLARAVVSTIDVLCGRGRYRVPPPFPVKTDLTAAMVAFDAARRAQGLPVPMTPEWDRLRGSFSGTIKLTNNQSPQDNRDLSHLLAPTRPSRPSGGVRGSVATTYWQHKTSSAAISKTGGLRGSSATRRRRK